MDPPLPPPPQRRPLDAPASLRRQSFGARAFPQPDAEPPRRPSSRQACERIGFFYLDGHGIPPAQLDAVFAASAAFFELPRAQKLGLSADGNNRGYTGMGDETLDPPAQSVGDTKEGYYIGREVSADSPEAAQPLHGPNVWPDESLLPGWRARRARASRPPSPPLAPRPSRPHLQRGASPLSGAQ